MSDEAERIAPVTDVRMTSALGAMFIPAAAIVSLPIAILVLLLTGFSVASDVVFGAEAMVSGLVTYWAFKRVLRKRLVISNRLPYSLMWLWVPLCIYVMVAQPFD